MDRVTFLQDVIYIVSTLGILVGIDLLLGANVTTSLNKILNKTVLRIDKAIVDGFNHCRKSMDSYVDVDDKLIKTKTKTVVGFLFIVICTILIFLARKG